MSLILATQDESDTPYNFINHFQNTIEIKPNSSIALNHITVNREFLLDFDEDKVYEGMKYISRMYRAQTKTVSETFTSINKEVKEKEEEEDLTPLF